MRWLALIAMLLASSASANEIDYFCIFANAAAAQADANVGPFWNGTTWDTSTTFPGISVTTPQALVNGISSLTGFWILVSRPAPDAGLDGNAACVMKLDRDLGKVNGSFVLAATITGTNRTSLVFKPQPMAVSGSAYPIPLGR
jgi:hypothetical protein